MFVCMFVFVFECMICMCVFVCMFVFVFECMICMCVRAHTQNVGYVFAYTMWMCLCVRFCVITVHIQLELEICVIFVSDPAVTELLWNRNMPKVHFRVV